jgi:hypothetical protein
LWVKTSVDGFNSKIGANGDGIIFLVEGLKIGEIGEFFEITSNSQAVALNGSSVVAYQ